MGYATIKNRFTTLNHIGLPCTPVREGMMASKRYKSGAWEYRVMKVGVLPKPQYLRFKDEAEGDAYIDRLERLLDAGVVPSEFLRDIDAPVTINQAVDKYCTEHFVPDSEERILITLTKISGKTILSQVDYGWAEKFIKHSKQAENLAPSTIRHRIGSLARMFDWLVRKNYLVANPFRLLPKGFATYTTADAAVLAALDKPVRADVSRWRRLGTDEEAAIRKVWDQAKPDDKERPLALPHKDDLLLLFDLALETAMRLREMYTLTADQIDLPERTIFLDRTKNGDSRQVPLSSVALARLQVRLQAGLHGQMFPWWSGAASPAELRRVTSLLSRQFARIFGAAGVRDLHFHDLRHEATCRLYERTTMSDLQISLITGHKDPRMLRRYANLRGSDLAKKMW